MMAGKNQVTLTLAGDSSSAEKAFDRTGNAAKHLGEKVGEAGKSFDDARERFDTLDQRAMGFRDTVTGLQDTVGGFSKILKGDLSADALFQAGAGVGDLASSMVNLLIPAVAAASGGFKALSITILTSPVTWIVLGIALIVTAFVILWKKSEAFRDFWKGLWSGIKEVAGAVADWFEKLPGRIGGFFKDAGKFISAPFRLEFNLIADAWNNTVGRLSWTVPSWVPLVGGNNVSAPRLPKFHSGGVVPGPGGSEMLAVVQAGETITPAGASPGRSIGPGDLRAVGGSGFDRLLLDYLAELLRANNLQLVPA